MCIVHWMSDGHASVGKKQEKVDGNCRGGEVGMRGPPEQTASEHTTAGVREPCPHLGKSILERRNQQRQKS